MPVRCLPLLKVIASTIFFIGLINPTVWAQVPQTPGTISLHGAGSTFAAPLYKKWIDAIRICRSLQSRFRMMLSAAERASGAFWRMRLTSPAATKFSLTAKAPKPAGRS